MPHYIYYNQVYLEYRGNDTKFDLMKAVVDIVGDRSPNKKLKELEKKSIFKVDKYDITH